MNNNAQTYWKCEASLVSSCPVAWWAQNVVVIDGLEYQINLQFPTDPYGGRPTQGGISLLPRGWKPTKREAALWLIADIEREIEDGRKKIELIKAWLESEGAD